MLEVLLLLASLFIFLAVIAVLGHGIWVLVAMLFGGGLRRQWLTRPCVFCRRKTPVDLERCDWCGKDLHGPLASELFDLEALRRQLRRFRESAVLKPEVVDTMVARVDAYRADLMRPPAAKTVVAGVLAPKPVAPKPVVPKPVVLEVVEPAKPQAAGTIAEPKPPAPVAAPPPQRSWAEMFAGFMEERNIRWGELIGGMLIVGPAIALVISFWEQLERNPYLQLTTFVSICSAVFGVGLYAHRRWKLESTSRAVLIIAALLVPLNFLAMAAVWKSQPGLGTMAADLISLGIFTWLVSLAARVLVPKGRWWHVLGVVGGSAAVLLIARLVTEQSPDWWFLAAGMVPVACFAGAIGGYLVFGEKERALDAPRSHALFALSGTAAFALAVALGLLVAQDARAHDGLALVLDRLSVLLAMAAMPILAVGLTVARGTAKDASLAAFHVAGTTVALLGAIAMGAAVVLAWPHPLAVLAVGAINGAVLAWAAFRYRLPILHAGTVFCAALVYLIGFHIVYNDLPLSSTGGEMLRWMIDATSGTALAGLFVLLGLTAEWLARRGRHRHGLVYAGGCAVVAAVGLVLVTWHGLAQTHENDALRAAILYAIYGTGGLALAARWRRAALTYVGLGLLAAGPMWALWERMHEIGPVWATMLAAEALVMGTVAAILFGRSKRSPDEPWDAGRARLKSPSLLDVYRIPLLHVCQVVAPIALLVGIITAWSVHASVMPVMTVAWLAAVYLLLAWAYRSPLGTWTASVIVLLGLVHTLALNYADRLEQPWLVAILVHSTLTLLAAVSLDLWTKHSQDQLRAEQIHRIFGKPLADMALCSSVLTLPLIPIVWSGTAAMAGCLFWLAAIWLAVACRDRDPWLLSAGQLALTAATLVGTTAWLEDRGWMTRFARDLVDPHNLQAYGIALGILSLIWAAARIGLRRHEAARKMLSPAWPSVDRVVFHIVVWTQWLVVAAYLLPGIGQEWFQRFPGPVGIQSAAVEGGAWLLVGLLGVVSIAALWQRWRVAELIGALLLAATVPCLIAGQWADARAVASALRWALALGFAVCSIAVWQRRALLQGCRRLAAQLELGAKAPAAARAVLLTTMAAPVLVLTIAAAALQIGGVSAGGPVAETFFDRMGPVASYLIPLMLVTCGLVGHAIRERSAGYAFAAGLVAELIVTLGYALHVATTGDGAFDTAELVTLLQLAAIAAAAWAGAWLAVRERLDVWRETPDGGSARVLMNVQLGMAAAGNVLLILPAVVSLVLFDPLGTPGIAAAGKPLGWISLAAVAAAYAYRRIRMGRRLQPDRVGWIGMAVLALLALAVCGQWPDSYWGYRTLMLSCAAFAWFIVSAMWWVASQRTVPGSEGPPQALIRPAAVWVRTAGILAVLLGVKAACFHRGYEELLWAAGAIAVAGAAGATMAVWRRREGWAFSAALGANLAASLVVWYFHHEDDFAQWWLRLIQANVIASSAVALVWLAARRRLYELREMALGQSPLLAVQIALPAIANGSLLLAPVFRLMATPDHLPDALSRLAEAPGWMGLVLTAAAAGWYLRETLPGKLLHVLAGLGLGAGALGACRATMLADRTLWPWPEYHTLTAAWAILGVLLLTIGMLGRNLRLSNLVWEASPRARRTLLLPSPLVQSWVTAIGVLVFILAVIHSAGDPSAPWWSAGALAAVSLTAGTIALWRREAAYVFASGLLLNVIGVIAWLAWRPPWWTPAGLVQTNVLCLAAGSILWSLIPVAFRTSVPHLQVGSRTVPFAPWAARGAVGLLTAVVGVAVMRDLVDLGHTALGPLDWIALAATAAATTTCLWDRSSRWSLPGLYVVALLGVALGWCVRDLSPRALCLTAGMELAGFALATTILVRLLPRWDTLWRALRIPLENRRWPKHWFSAVQAAVVAAAALLAVWISLDVGFDEIAHRPLAWLSGRKVAAWVVGMLLPVAVLLASRSKSWWREAWQHASLWLGLLLLNVSGFAWLGSGGDHRWLYAGVILMVAATAMNLASGLALGRLLGEKSDWRISGRRSTPAFGALAMAAMAAVLVQEGFLFGHELPPVAWPAVVVVVAALAGLIAVCLAMAVRPDWEPLHVNQRARTIYVYAAEALGGLIGLHLWLTRPELFELGLMRYWMLIVMAVAFAGAGLSEWFQRVGLPVLSEPLRRTALLVPLVPAIGFWFSSDPASPLGLVGRTPVLWFMMGLFYGYMALSERSAWLKFWLGLLAIGAGNMGLWVLWHHQGWGFVERPQLWLIPPALAVLVAEHLDRRRLNEAQRTALRYFALSIVYVSSTAECWRETDHWVLPLVTILLSVLGVLAGVLLRVRSFLYLGAAFLTVVIGRMIYYAAFQQGPEPRWWIIWACCIALGAAIIALFAVYEKRGQEIRDAMKRFGQWEA